MAKTSRNLSGRYRYYCYNGCYGFAVGTSRTGPPQYRGISKDNYAFADRPDTAVADFFHDWRPIAGIICLILQITLIGWLPATIWAVYSLSQYKTDQKIADALRRR
jgi:hypothetical protein